ncbi:MAG: hypothetical protein AB7K24_05570 [Gemmataceae bacterium]
MNYDPLNQVAAARFAEVHLGRLAALRVHPDIHIRVADGLAWLRWQQEDSEVLRAVLPIPGAEFFVRHEEHWYRFGSRLPAFDVQFETGMTSLERVLVPALPAVTAADTGPLDPVSVRLVVASARQRASAVLTSLAVLEAWAEQLPAAALETLRALRCGNEVLIVGRKLPVLAEARRFWGASILVPMGQRLEPRVPEKALRAALGVADNELLLFDEGGVEVLPGDDFEPLSRGSIKRALGSEFRLGEPAV